MWLPRSPPWRSRLVAESTPPEYSRAAPTAAGRLVAVNDLSLNLLRALGQVRVHALQRGCNLRSLAREYGVDLGGSNARASGDSDRKNRPKGWE